MISSETEEHILVPLPPLKYLVPSTKISEFLNIMLAEKISSSNIISEIITYKKCECVDTPSPVCLICQSYIKDKLLKHKIIQKKHT